ncbi:MAG TPA: hypothetical protein VG796_04100 [Verrucomicrobiales bacterium]|nr:hypothetical protein [Verrucomicrobiales bacterium]
MDENPYTTPAVSDPVRPRVRLWNPQAAAGWSVLFTPIFGSLVHARNWITLGKPNLAKINYLWAAGVAAFLLVMLFVPGIEIPRQLGSLIGIGILLGWFYSIGKRQVEEVKSFGPPPQGYEKKSWAMPMGIAVLILSAVVAVCVVIFNRAVSPDAIAAQLKPDVEKAWLNSPDVKEAHVDSITFTSTENYHYKGTVTGSIDGKSVNVPITVTIKPSTGEMEWRTGE